MTRRIAIALLKLASKMLPPARREWARDMRGELDVVKSDHAALSWAFGCVLASIQERVLAMMNLSGRISRPVLMLEWLMCFVPLTLLWAVAVNLAITRDDIPAPLLVAAAFGTLGPIALIVSLAATASKRNEDTRRIARVLASGFALMVVLQILSATAGGNFDLRWPGLDLGTFFLLFLLPLLGALHFYRLAHAGSSGSVDATANR